MPLNTIEKEVPNNHDQPEVGTKYSILPMPRYFVSLFVKRRRKLYCKFDAAN